MFCDTSPNRPLDLPQTRFLQCFGKEIKNSTFIRAASVGVMARVTLPNAYRSDQGEQALCKLAAMLWRRIAFSSICCPVHEGQNEIWCVPRPCSSGGVRQPQVCVPAAQRYFCFVRNNIVCAGGSPSGVLLSSVKINLNLCQVSSPFQIEGNLGALRKSEGSGGVKLAQTNTDPFLFEQPPFVVALDEDWQLCHVPSPFMSWQEKYAWQAKGSLAFTSNL